MTKRGGALRTGTTRGLRDVLGLTLARHRLQGGVSRARSIVLWPEVVGPELARLTRARTQQGQTLFIEVRDSSMAHFLTMQRAAFLSLLQEKLGDQSVTELRFSVGRLSKQVVPTPVTPLPPPDQARAHELARSAPESLHDVTLKAAEAVTRARRWREQQGYRPCPVCGEASATQPCRACSLSVQDPNVKRAAVKLAREPQLLGRLSATLGHSGSDAARYLALQALSAQMDVLALECVRSGGEVYYRAFLKQQAELYLQLTHRRFELTRGDWDALPAPVLQVLSAGPQGL